MSKKKVDVESNTDITVGLDEMPRVEVDISELPLNGKTVLTISHGMTDIKLKTEYTLYPIRADIL